jgi:threonine dehydrogenase-like Zn-dependent dehydrogenase
VLFIPRLVLGHPYLSLKLSQLPHISNPEIRSYMSNMQALTLSSFGEPPKLISKPIPEPIPGSLVVKVLYSNVLAYANDVYITRSRPYPMPVPLTIGSSSVARIHTVGPDATLFKEGQLVLVDVFIKSRDDHGTNFLFGLHGGFTEGANKLSGGGMLRMYLLTCLDRIILSGGMC